ncbi:hypothetical protein D187_002578 [Cystobacter fuscus DSM 2262]|uniref:Uncharacterized protein n=1 Tax=Cystobacter fuscus (strain ATCC 25194 / DSM 2262 / NBRC 100088 / M29) TaxID=1242864 RepID=S9QES7_CYSF2|nr:hypothetical protein D187_002578 [Cystobacter fuscus DSM 2262]
MAVMQCNMGLARDAHENSLARLALLLQPGLRFFAGLKGRNGGGRNRLLNLLKVAFEYGVREELTVIHFTDMHDDVVLVCNQYESAVRRFGVLP